MKVIKQSLPNQNTYAVVANLVMQLGLKISAQGLKEIMGHKEYPNLFAISDTLSNWHVENMAVNLSAYQLKEIPYPAIAHLYKNSGHFVVLQKLDGELLNYIDPEIGLVKGKPTVNYTLRGINSYNLLTGC
jgi:ABC-type bacteriocin/lantibiotic exporter with double-glycine peptidase domain